MSGKRRKEGGRTERGGEGKDARDGEGVEGRERRKEEGGEGEEEPFLEFNTCSTSGHCTARLKIGLQHYMLP